MNYESTSVRTVCSPAVGWSVPVLHNNAIFLLQFCSFVFWTFFCWFTETLAYSAKRTLTSKYWESWPSHINFVHGPKIFLLYVFDILACYFSDMYLIKKWFFNVYLCICVVPMHCISLLPCWGASAGFSTTMKQEKYCVDFTNCKNTQYIRRVSLLTSPPINSISVFFFLVSVEVSWSLCCLGSGH